MVAFLTVHKMTKRQPAKKATGAFMAVANMHIYQARKHGVSSGPLCLISLLIFLDLQAWFVFRTLEN